MVAAFLLVILLQQMFASCNGYRIVTPRIVPSGIIRLKAATEEEIRPVTNTGGSPGHQPTPSAVEDFIVSCRSALSGDSSQLETMLLADTRWETPVVGNLNELKKGLQQFSNYFQEPALTVFSVSEMPDRKYKLDYQLSFWYPMIWRPRIIIPATAVLELSSAGKVVSVKETWAIGLRDIFLRQLPPRFWDLWNSFSTPAPEFPPVREIARVGQVAFLEMPQTVAVEVRWSGPAKYPGPPLLAVPGFGLFGTLRTSRPNRDPFYTVLPVEVLSGRYVCAASKEEMKRTSWLMHVPTSLQALVWARAVGGAVEDLRGAEEADEQDDLVDERDYVVGLENASGGNADTAGVLRGDVAFDEAAMRDFEAKERREVLYKLLPRRLIAAAVIKGEATPERISSALQDVKDTVLRDGARVLGRPARLRLRDLDSAPGVDGTPMLGLQLWGTKVGFNPRGEPAIAAYELQYSSRVTKVFVELTLE